MKRTFLVAVAAGAAALAAGLALAARGPDPGAVPTETQVSERTMSPFCPGLTVSECPSSQSAELRTRIAGKVGAGWTNRRIDEWLVEDYGEAVLARPRDPFAYLVPIGVVLAGLALVVVLITRWGRSGGVAARETDALPEGANDPSPRTDPPSNSEKERLDSELRLFAEGTE